MRQYRQNSRQKKPQKHSASPANRAQKLPRNTGQMEIDITHIGGRGDGVALAPFTHHYETKERFIFVPHTLPGERVRVQPVSLSAQGIHAEMVELIDASPERREPPCPVAMQCGGCQLQHMSETSYRSEKEQLVRQPLERAGLKGYEWRTPVFSPLSSRRRVRFGFRRTSTRLIIGLHERQSDKLIEPEGCVTIDPDILAVRAALADKLSDVFSSGHAGDMHLTCLDQGVDVLIHLHAPADNQLMARLSQTAPVIAGLARLTLQADDAEDLPLYMPEPPRLSWPECHITPPAGSFLQATISGERTLQQAVAEMAEPGQRIIDLFCGSGTLSLPLLATSCHVYAADVAGPALNAFNAAADKAGYGHQLRLSARNLYEAPLTKAEFEEADLVILDPPRAGARDQITTLADSRCPKIAYISCNPHSFAKDAAILTASGYHLDWVQMVDQFLYTSHAELVAQFTYKAPV